MNTSTTVVLGTQSHCVAFADNVQLINDSCIAIEKSISVSPYKVIGVDLEWHLVDSTKHLDYVLIGTESMGYVFWVANGIPLNLRKLLLNGSIVKVGFGTENDLLILAHEGINVPILDIQSILYMRLGTKVDMVTAYKMWNSAYVGLPLPEHNGVPTDWSSKASDELLYCAHDSIMTYQLHKFVLNPQAVQSYTSTEVTEVISLYSALPGDRDTKIMMVAQKYLPWSRFDPDYKMFLIESKTRSVSLSYTMVPSDVVRFTKWLQMSPPFVKSEEDMIKLLANSVNGMSYFTLPVKNREGPVRAFLGAYMSSPDKPSYFSLISSVPGVVCYARGSQ